MSKKNKKQFDVSFENGVFNIPVDKKIKIEAMESNHRFKTGIDPYNVGDTFKVTGKPEKEKQVLKSKFSEGTILYVDEHGRCNQISEPLTVITSFE